MSTSDGPIFIGGLDRSGKTPLRLMLSCHPNLSLTRRTSMWTQFYNHFGRLSQGNNFERCLAVMMRHQPIRRLEPDLERIRREFWRGQPTYARLFAIFHEQYAERVGKPRWGDQLAFIERYADPIFEAFPDGRMIHMIRHPRERFEVSEPQGRYRRGKVGWDVARWLFSVRLGQRNQQRYPDNYRMIKYEALVCHPKETLREVCEFIGEELYPGMLTMQGAMRFGEDRTDAVSEDFEFEREKPVPPARMSEQERFLLSSWARREMQALGYRESHVRLSSQDALKLYTVDGPVNVIGALLWNVSKKV